MASTLKVNTIQHTGGTSGISIDSGGRVDAKVPMFHAKRSSNFTTASPYTAIYDTVQFDTDNWYSTSTGRYTPQKAGYYYFMGQWSLASINTAHYINVTIRKNGTAMFNYADYAGASTYPRPQVSGLLQLNGSSDYVDIHIQFSGGANAIWTDSQGNNFIGHYLGSGS